MPVLAPTCYGQRCSELRHHAASHAQDDSKKLKYDQIVAIRDAVVTAHQLSAATLRRNMEMHDSPTKTIPAEHMRSFQHQVYRARKKLCAKQLKGFEMDDSYGQLQMIPAALETERKEGRRLGRRTSGRSSGAGHRKD